MRPLRGQSVGRRIERLEDAQDRDAVTYRPIRVLLRMDNEAGDVWLEDALTGERIADGSK
jgi:hypothetical protein